MGKIKLRIGQKILFHEVGNKEIREGTVDEISPSGKVLKVKGKWYSEETSLTLDGPREIRVLDELGAERKGPVTIEQEEDVGLTWPRG